jgi:tetratricopeptide (TPR) repeat protein
MAQARFGELLWQAIQQARANTGRSIGAIKRDLAALCHVEEETVDKWKSRSIPPPDTVALLARWSVEKVGMKRSWLAEFMQAGDYYDGGVLERQFFDDDRTALPTVRDNVPPLRSDFIPRPEAINRVREGMAMPHPLVSIEGMSGVGKTTLACKVARMCLAGEIGEIAPFEAIVWISAKGNEDLSLAEALDIIADVLGYAIVRQLPDEEKRAAMDRLLRAHRTLVIVDNFETVPDSDLADFLQRVPPPSKAVITTRVRHLRRLWDVDLHGLLEAEAFQKIREHSYSRGLHAVAQADEATLRPLVAITDGNPKAIEMALGYIKEKNMALDEVVHSLAEASEDVEDLFKDLFARAWDLLPEEGRRLLMIMPFFADSASREALAAAADVHGFFLRTALAQLLDMSLLETTEELVEARKRYSAHPLVLAFAGARLKEQLEWEQGARRRWSDFFVHHVELYGDDDLGEDIGGGKIGHREKLQDEIENLLLAIEWCFKHRSEKAVRLVERITTFLLDEGKWSDREKFCSHALEVAQTPASRAGLLTRLGWNYLVQGKYRQAREAQEEGLNITWQHNNLQARRVQLLRDFGNLCALQGDYTLANRLYAESLELAERIGQEIGILLAKVFRARTAYVSGHYQEAKLSFLEALPKFKKFCKRDVVMILRFLGDIAISEGRFDEARAYLQEALDSVHISYEAHEEAQLSRSWGDLERVTGNWEAARKAYEKALHLSKFLEMSKEIEQLEQKLQEIERLLMQPLSVQSSSISKVS